ncbi:MAG: nitrous oxide-stimulated promoter family protein [Bacillota bacterium]
MSVQLKREEEKKTIKYMVTTYCRHKHGSAKGELCEECQGVLDYSFKRIDNCPFMETKTFCTNCKVHCFRKENREKIVEIMKFSGKYMMFTHPIKAFQHVASVIKNKRENKKESANGKG